MSCWHNPTDNVFKVSFFKGGQKLDFRWEPNGYCDVPDEFDRLVKLEVPAAKKVKAGAVPVAEPEKKEVVSEPAKAAVESPKPADKVAVEAKAKPEPKVEAKSVAVMPASPKKEKK